MTDTTDNTPDVPELSTRPKTGFLETARSIAWELFTTVAPALIVVLFINVFVAEATVVKDGPSMQPNIYRGERVLMEKISYHLHPPRRGDVVVAERPDGEIALIKRVIGLPGEVIEVRQGHVWINGEPLDESWVAYFGGPGYPATRVPDDCVFILGDNRPNSRDSRAIGPVPLSTIRGRGWMIYWPPSEIKIGL